MELLTSCTATSKIVFDVGFGEAWTHDLMPQLASSAAVDYFPMCYCWLINSEGKHMSTAKIFLVSSVVSTLVACGGGGGSALNGNPTSAVSYQAVATEGELVSYSVDTTALTYSYEVLESAYGKTGATGNGQLTRNADGTYTPSGFNGKVAVLQSGLLLGAIYEDLNNDGTREVVPIIGMSNPVNSLAEAVGTYNFISRQCGISCTNYYGTVKVNSDGTWNSCVGANLAATTYTCNASASGGVTSMASGRATLTLNGVAGGSMLIFKDPTTGQKAVLLDLNGRTGLGKGAIFAADQSLPSSADGDWTYLHTNGTRGAVTVSGNTFTDTGRFSNGTSFGPSPGSFTVNLPWSGFITTSTGAIIMPTGSGLYAAYFGANNTLSVGVKK
jgi:hypothetical protein